MFRVVEYLIQAGSRDTNSFRLVGLDSRGPGASWQSPWYLLKACWQILCFALKQDLAGVHVHMAERLSVYRKGALIIWARLLGVPVILHLHAAQLPAFYAASSVAGRWIVRFIFGKANHTVVLGRVAESFVVDELRVPPSKVSIVVNGVPPPKFQRRIRRQEDPFRLLFLGNLTERKGVSDLLQAFSQLPKEIDCRLSCAGGGDIERYRARASALGVGDRVDFLGWQDQCKASSLVANADILILPSYDEGLPLVILEALSNGVAVICTPVGEIPNFLKNDEVVMVTPGNARQLSAAIESLILDNAKREKLESNGRMAYQRSFSIDNAYEAVCSLYRRTFSGL